MKTKLYVSKLVLIYVYVANLVCTGVITHCSYRARKCGVGNMVYKACPFITHATPQNHIRTALSICAEMSSAWHHMVYQKR